MEYKIIAAALLFLSLSVTHADVLSKNGNRKSAVVKKCKVEERKVYVTACDETVCNPPYTPNTEYSCLTGGTCEAKGGGAANAFVVNDEHDAALLAQAIESPKKPKVVFWNASFDRDVPKALEVASFEEASDEVKGFGTILKGYKTLSFKQKETHPLSYLDVAPAFQAVLSKMPSCPFKD